MRVRRQQQRCCELRCSHAAVQACRRAGKQAGGQAGRRAGWGFVDVRLEAAQRERPAKATPPPKATAPTVDHGYELLQLDQVCSAGPRHGRRLFQGQCSSRQQWLWPLFTCSFCLCEWSHALPICTSNSLGTLCANRGPQPGQA